ncbi:MAG: class I SAM-dependent methyltransferase [Solirubrobacterales bacterium]
MATEAEDPEVPPTLRPVTPLGVLAAKLEQIRTRIERLAPNDPDLQSELREACSLASGMDPFLALSTTPASADLEDLNRRTLAGDWLPGADGPAPAGLEPEMLSGHVEGQFLKFLVAATGARRVLEIGMFTGYSALAMAEALPDDGRLVTCEIDDFTAAFAERCFATSKAGKKISIEVAPAKATLEKLSVAGRDFDLVFIDADKGGYVEYFQTVLDGGLLAPGGIICADNTLMQGQPWMDGEATDNGEAIAHFNRTVAEDPRVEQVLVPLRDGVTLIRKVA